MKAVLALLSEVMRMGVLTVRNLDDDVQRRIRRRAAENGRSMEAEARAILSAAVMEKRLVSSWLDAAADLQGEDLEVPRRSVGRTLDLA